MSGAKTVCLHCGKPIDEGTDNLTLGEISMRYETGKHPLLTAADELAAAVNAFLSQAACPTETEILDYASLNEGRANMYDVTLRQLFIALAAYRKARGKDA